MPVNTITVGAAVTPTVIHTYISHYLNRGPLRQKPTAHISYHEGLELIRQFLRYASFHTVEELQAFTSQWVPVPIWVDVDRIEIPTTQLDRSAEYIRAQLGPEGLKAVGGQSWWEWRHDEWTGLKAEWIEMRKDMEDRKKSPHTKGQRIMLYIHGGAYFFGSVDEHRYQMQRHARKLKARVLAPRYRLAPQFPFPCGLMDCLAAYLFLLEQKHDPSTIVLAGDSAGGGMVLSLLIILRDQNIPLPAGAVLISPWVDLTHSFPSLNGDGKMDYIPAHGFIHKPSISWPPPNADDLLAFERARDNPKKKTSRPNSARNSKDEKELRKEEKTDRIRGFSVQSKDKPDLNKILESSTSTAVKTDTWVSDDGKYSIGPKSMLSLQLEDARVEIKDQIQLYAPNHMLTHPLVSPALQPSLGGLPPLLIQVGGGELLKDEQIYIAHKAAAPLSYLPPPSNHQNAQAIQEEAARHKPTNVQLQVWDDMCHVGPTLSFTRPAKHMYRSIAQFSAWALARAQKTSIDIMDDDSISIVSADSSTSSNSKTPDSNVSSDQIKLNMPQSAQHVDFSSLATKSSDATVGRAGDPLPPFKSHMIRHRVDRHGRIFPLPAPSEFEALNLPPADIGVPKPGPVNKWMKAQQQWNGKFSKQKLKVQKQRIKDMQKGYEGFNGENPPPTALAGRRVKGMQKTKKPKKSWGMALWSVWGSKHDEATLTREEQADQSPTKPDPTTTTVEAPSTTDNNTATSPVPTTAPRSPRSRKSFRNSLLPPSRSRSRSHHSAVTYQNQTSSTSSPDLALANLAPPIPGYADATVLAPERTNSAAPTPVIEMPRTPDGAAPDTLIPPTDTLTTRPTRGGVAYPFRLRVDGEDGREVNASTLTLESMQVSTPAAVDDDVKVELGRDGAVADAAVVTEDAGKDEESAGKEEGGAERPAPERFFTANDMADVLRSAGDGEGEGGAGAGVAAVDALGGENTPNEKAGTVADEVDEQKPVKDERPGLGERFETAASKI